MTMAMTTTITRIIKRTEREATTRTATMIIGGTTRTNLTMRKRRATAKATISTIAGRRGVLASKRGMMMKGT